MHTCHLLVPPRSRLNVRDTLAQWSARRDRITVKLECAAMIYRMVTWGEVTLPDGSHPICLCLCLFPGSNAAVHQVIVAAGDGVLGSHMSFVVVVNYRARSVLQEWNFFQLACRAPLYCFPIQSISMIACGRLTGLGQSDGR